MYLKLFGPDYKPCICKARVGKGRVAQGLTVPGKGALLGVESPTFMSEKALSNDHKTAMTTEDLWYQLIIR